MIIKVTQDHINNAMPSNRVKGAIALALQDAGSKFGTCVEHSFIVVTHPDHGWDENFFLCSDEIRLWQSDAIKGNEIEPIDIEFDEENKVVRQVF